MGSGNSERVVGSIDNYTLPLDGGGCKRGRGPGELRTRMCKSEVLSETGGGKKKRVGYGPTLGVFAFDARRLGGGPESFQGPAIGAVAQLLESALANLANPLPCDAHELADFLQCQAL